MAFPTVPTLPFAPGTDSVPASVLNAWRAFFPSCLDADGGGTYTNLTPIVFGSGSAGVEFDGPISVGAGIHYGLSSRSVTRVLALQVKALGNSPQFLGWEVSDNWGTLRQTSTSSVQNLIFELDDIPDGATITEVALWVEGATGHASVSSSIVLPEITLRIASKTGAATTGGATTDLSGTIAAYEAPHDIRLTGLSVVIDRTTNRYAMSMVPESGANAVVGLIINAVEVVYTISRIPE